MEKTEGKIVMALVLTSVIITGSMLVYTILTLPPQEGFPAISVLNQDLQAVGLIQANNASQFSFHVLVQNYLGHVEYFRVDVWRGRIIGDVNPPLNSCIHWGNFSKIIVDGGEHMFTINDTLYTTQQAERYIYYCMLYVFNIDGGEFEAARNAFGETIMVWMQVNVTT